MSDRPVLIEPASQILIIPELSLLNLLNRAIPAKQILLL
jgi:hypothetical protein